MTTLKAILDHLLLIAFYLAASLACGWLWSQVARCMFVPGAVGTFLLLCCVYVGAEADRGNDDTNRRN